MSAHDYLIWFFLINSLGLLVAFVEIGLNLRNWLILVFYNLKQQDFSRDFDASEAKIQLRANLEKEFRITFQYIFELIEALTYGYIIYNLMTYIRYMASFTVSNSLFKQSLLLLVISIVFLIANVVMIRRDKTINKYILDYYDNYKNKESE